MHEGSSQSNKSGSPQLAYKQNDNDTSKHNYKKIAKDLRNSMYCGLVFDPKKKDGIVKQMVLETLPNK